MTVESILLVLNISATLFGLIMVFVAVDTIGRALGDANGGPK